MSQSVRPPWALLLVALMATAGLAACDDDSGDVAATSTVSAVPVVTPGPVAAVDLVTGDCLAGLVIGVAERVRIDAAQVVPCDDRHDLEVFATFRLAPGDFDGVTDGSYPGQERVTEAADVGCVGELETLGIDDGTFGLIALWPTDESWRADDRSVGCAVFSPEGQAFERRVLLSSEPAR